MREIKFLFAFCLLALAVLQAHTQNGLATKATKGKIFVQWGYNRAFYNTSDISFKGDGYDFTLHDAQAYDSAERDLEVYVDIKRLTIPQFNFRAGYLIRDGLALTLGWDHMKYRLNVPQYVRMSGYISPERSARWQGNYDNTLVELSPDLVRIEHTDGFNVLRAGLEYYHPFWNSKNQKHALNFMLAGSAGVTLPWTDTFLFGGPRNRTQPHLAGVAVSGLLGLRFEFFEHFYAQWRAQYGFAHMGDILIEDGTDARASQNFKYFERALMVGGYFRIGKTAKEPKKVAP